MSATITWYETQRGFRIGRFTDRYGFLCTIQKSSLATEDAIWLGIEKNRMHLTQAQVADLLPVLTHFAQTGELP